MSENRESCDCRKVADYDAVERSGDFYFEAGLLHIELPAGCFIAIKIAKSGQPCEAHPSWTGPVWKWDGNEDKPTLEPSIHTVGRWHGHLRAGRLESC